MWQESDVYTIQLEIEDNDRWVKVEVSFDCDDGLYLRNYQILETDQDENGNDIKLDWLTEDYLIEYMYAQGIYADYKY